jgi:hypothetical protein
LLTNIGKTYCTFQKERKTKRGNEGIAISPVLAAVLGIRIRRIRMVLGLLDPDPDSIVRGTDPDPAPDPYLFLINVLSGLK